MNYSIVTFGCRVNQADALAIEAELCAGGGVAVPSDRADLVIVNTCSVTASADQGARQTIRRVARENPAARIVATGCYATRCPDEVAALPGVVAVVPNSAKHDGIAWSQFRPVDSKVRPAIFYSESGGAVATADGPCGRALAPGLMGRTAWTLRVQTGCEEACSYCIIPTTRGASRSRTLEDIRDEVERVAAAGYKEIAVTGVHLGSYGRDLAPRSSLAELLTLLQAAGSRIQDGSDDVAAYGGRDVAFHGGRDRPAVPLLFRISSLEPMDFPREILDLAGASGDASPGARVMCAPHFHLPLQHAANRILQLMRRPYTLAVYSALVDEIRDRLPHAAIGSDVITGFPGETDEDFDVLTSYLEESPLTHLHVFPYSDRPGTVAALLPGKVHGSIVKARAQRLRGISRNLQERFRAAQRGTTRPALTIEDGSVAITDNYFRVAAPPGHQRNEWITATL